MGATNPYKLVTTVRQEIDLRLELHQILYGDGETLKAHGRIVILRHFRTDINNRRVKCGCISGTSFSDTPKAADFSCRFCRGEGYLFDDALKVAYLAMETPYTAELSEEKWGLFQGGSPSIFFEYNTEIKEWDVILQPQLTVEGKLPVGPISIEKRYRINRLQDLRSDNGRIEFFRCIIAEDHI